MTQQPQLLKIYKTISNSGSYGGVEKLYRAAKENGLDISRNGVQNFLQEQETYTLHKPIRKHFKRNQIIVGGIDKQWQADLADFTDLAKFNNGFRYLLTVIDCFSKFAWAIPTKTKDGPTIAIAFTDLFKISKPRFPEKLQTDRGKEFLNKHVQEIFKKYKIHHFVTNNEPKAAIVERFNRTIKTKLFTYFTENNTYQFITKLPSFMEAYNNSYHRSIGMAPNNVRKCNERKVWLKLYARKLAETKFKNKVIGKDDHVRISKVKSVFEKGYMPNWTDELFIVKEQRANNLQNVYKLVDTSGEEIEGTFYPEEIQKVIKFNDSLYKIEKIIKTRKVKGKTEYFVKWKHWPAKFNSWVTNLENVETR